MSARLHVHWWVIVRMTTISGVRRTKRQYLRARLSTASVARWCDRVEHKQRQNFRNPIQF
eukprot:313098-Alexandrium_andersonii.AAC.1